MNVILRGRGASRGIVKGKIRIIMSADEIEELNDGEILVVPFADSSFTAAMQRALGLITDNGGITCHAAIVARELGIPAVVGTGEATKKLKNEMEVIIDGKNGIVYA
ncbi:MAG: hypothetical protein J7J38_02765 [Candidatus Aenigmarchaeota archaeon]|nr:hypothetical protein [Candidatus Aenigmarchaeota archaeon]